MVVTEAALATDFRKKPFEDVDRTFLLVLLFSTVLHFGLIAFSLLYPISLKSSEISIRTIQEQYANVVLKRADEAISAANSLSLGQQAVSPEEAQMASEIKENVARRQQARRSGGAATDMVAPSGRAEGSGSRSLTGGRSAGQTGEGSSGGRKQYQQQIEEEVASEGILGILTASSGSSSSQAGQLRDVLGEGGKASSEYEQIFQNVDKLTSSGSGKVKGRTGAGSGSGDGAGGGGGAARGSRTTEGGNIDALVSGLGTAQSTSSLQRTTDIVSSNLAPLTEEGEEMNPGGISSGARDLDEVSAIVQEHSAAIRFCYERELKRNPDLKGKVSVRFTITPAGTVTNAKIISTTLNSDTVERCILSRISRWDDFGSIDPTLGNATFRQVFTFGF
jgi:hypothetical protein